MKKISYLFLISLILSCQTIENPAEYISNNTNTNTILINDLAEQETVIVKPDEITLFFKMKAYNGEKKEFYAYRIAAYLDSSIFTGVKIGISQSQIPAFSPGTGMASSGMYNALIINKNAHHYIFHNPSSPETSRVNIIEQNGNIFLCSVSFNKIHNDGVATYFAQMSGKKIYLLIYYDNNLNKIIDAGELNKLILVFQ